MPQHAVCDDRGRCSDRDGCTQRAGRTGALSSDALRGYALDELAHPRAPSGHDRDEARLPPDLDLEPERPLEERPPLDRRCPLEDERRPFDDRPRLLEDDRLRPLDDDRLWLRLERLEPPRVPDDERLCPRLD